MTNERMQKAMECRSAEELLALARENNIEMTLDEATAKFVELHAEGELEDDELENAAGGSCSEPNPQKGEVWIIKSKYKERYCPSCQCNTVIYNGEECCQFANLPNTVNLTCTQCGTEYSFCHNWETKEFMTKA